MYKLRGFRKEKKLKKQYDLLYIPLNGINGQQILCLYAQEYKNI